MYNMEGNVGNAR